MNLDPLGCFEAYGYTPHLVTHFHARTPQILTAKVRAYFKGTKMLLIPVGRGEMRVQDPYGRQIPYYKVIRTNKPIRYWFQQITWTKEEFDV